MKRAAVLIGVDKTGNLPELKDAAKGTRRMKKWATQQGMDPITVLTDEHGPVDVGDIKKAIRKVVDAGADQLVIYFAGHGVNIGYGEYWLLSDAPVDSQAAVNVEGSNILARYCGIPHVVFISDACRTAAEGIQAQRVTGSEIFPNETADTLENPVDLFFACTLGRPAHEVRDPNITASEFTALYTSELHQALLGKRPEILALSKDKPDIALLRPQSLKTYLSSAISRRIKDLALQTKIIQVPDARLTSDKETAWISSLTYEDIPASWWLQQAKGGLEAPPSPSESAEKPPITVASVSTSLVQSVLDEDSTKLSTELEKARTSDVAGARDLVVAAEQIAKPFGPTHFESKCGFKIRGARIIEAYSRAAQTELFEMPGQVVRVDTDAYSRASVLLVLEQGTGILLPAIPDFIGVLTVEEGELVDVAYEPSDNSWRWAPFWQRAAEIRALRSIASSSMTRGVFRLEGANALEIAKRMQYAKGVDPTLAVYAAYAYNDLRRRDLIREMSRYMRDDIGAPLFDVAMLSGELNARNVANSDVFSYMPLLAQGWALLSAYRVSLPDSLAELHRTLVPSVWTMFDQEGIRQIRNSFHKGDLR
jgi:hypothetical protein